MVYLDTHLVVWLYAGEKERLSSDCAKLLEKEELVISPIVSLELQYLFEIKKLKVGPTKITKTLSKEIGLKFCNSSFPETMVKAIGENWTRDPFDRIIVAQAKLNSSLLLSKDRLIRNHYNKAVW